MYGEGISKLGAILDMASDVDIIKKLGHGTLMKMKDLDKVERTQKII